MRRFSSTSKQSNGEEGHYWISISDLMTSLLFIFILAFAYTVQQIQDPELRDKIAELEQIIENLEIENNQLQARIQELEKLNNAAGENFNNRAELLVEIQKELKLNNIDVDIDPRNGNMRIKSDALFDSASAELKPEGRNIIIHLGKEIKRQLESNPKYHQAIDTIFIEGHTDSVPYNRGLCFGTPCSNRELSSQRAINTFIAMNYAVGIGEMTNANGKKLFSYSGYADTRPAVLDDNAKNRRIELFFALHNPAQNQTQAKGNK